jgi:prepilin-type N-terminal cleavage/methylation domain-containing protein
MQKRMRKAFTLLELIVVVVVLGILALVAVPAFSGVINNSTDSVAKNTAAAIARDANALAAFNSGPTANVTSDGNIDAAIGDTTLNTADGWTKSTSSNSVSLVKNGNTETFYICVQAIDLDGDTATAAVDRAVVSTSACAG